MRGKKEHDPLVLESLAYIVHFLPHILDSVSVLNAKSSSAQMGSEPFDVQICDYNPQQENGLVELFSLMSTLFM